MSAYAKNVGDIVKDRAGNDWTVIKLDGEDMTVQNAAGKTWTGLVTDMRTDGDTKPTQSTGRRSRNSQGSTQANKGGTHAFYRKW